MKPDYLFSKFGCVILSHIPYLFPYVFFISHHRYNLIIAYQVLHSAGLYVSVVNAVLVHDYGNNSLRRVKTDKKDSLKLAEAE